MNVAVIDLGTNTFNLLICEVSHSSYSILFHTKTVPKLGKESFFSGILPAKAIKRGLKALQTLNSHILQHNCDSVIAIGTSALRYAKNAQDFVDAVDREYGFTISIISGEQEAEYIYLGNKLAFDWGMQTVLIIDIGGGSNECVLCEGERLVWKKSFENGMQRIRNAYTSSFPLQHDVSQAIADYLIETFQELHDVIRAYNIDVLIGSSGPFDTFRDMCVAKNGNVLSNSSSYEFEKNEILSLFSVLLNSNLAQLIAVPGMEEARAEHIPVAVLITQYLFELCGEPRIVQSSFSLKEGVISTLIS
jgi:exopolyphosphatase/guanosine-5'-triphosphate,3'-diphosphate pyrophosphatase